MGGDKQIYDDNNEDKLQQQKVCYFVQQLLVYTIKKIK